MSDKGKHTSTDLKKVPIRAKIPPPRPHRSKSVGEASSKNKIDNSPSKSSNSNANVNKIGGFLPVLSSARGITESPKKTKTNAAKFPPNDFARVLQSKKSELNVTKGESNIEIDNMISVLKEKLSWFGENWEKENMTKKKEVLEALSQCTNRNNNNKTTNNNVNVSDISLRPKFTARSPSKQLEIFGSRRNRAESVLGVIDMGNKAKTFVGNLVVIANENDIKQIDVNSWNKYFVDILSDIFSILSTTQKNVGDNFSTFFDNYMKEINNYKDNFVNLLACDGSNFAKEVPASMSLTTVELKQNIRFLLIKIRSSLEDICVLLLKDKCLSDSQKLCILIYCKHYVDNLVQLAQQISIFVSYSLIEKRAKKDLARKTRELQISEDSFNVNQVKNVFENEDRSNWPSGGYTIDALIHDVAIAETYDTNLLKTFISTHQAFISSSDLLHKLVTCFFVATSRGDQKDAIQIRICIALKYWIESNISDFRDLVSVYFIIMIEKK